MYLPRVYDFDKKPVGTDTREDFLGGDPVGTWAREEGRGPDRIMDSGSTVPVVPRGLVGPVSLGKISYT